MDWTPLFLAAFAALVILYLPGVLIVRSCRFSWLASFAVAPAISSFFYVAQGVIFDFFGVSMRGETMLVIPTCIGAVLFLICTIAHTINKRRLPAMVMGRQTFAKNRLIDVVAIIEHKLPDNMFLWMTLLVYVVFAFVVACIVFLGGIESPDTFSREFDAGYHYSAIRSFNERGTYSVFNAGIYPGQEESPTFYPALWHIVSSMTMDISAQPLAVCANAVIFAGLAFVLPISSLGLLGWIFSKKPMAIVCGCVCVLAFTGYPWGNLIFGQIVSNYFSNALMISALLLYMVFLNSCKYMTQCFVMFLLLLFSLIACGGTQPNSVFSAGIFMVFYSMHFAAKCISESRTIYHENVAKFFACLGIFVLGCILWIAFHQIPFIQEISTFNEFVTYTPTDAIIRCIFLSFSVRLLPQFVLAVIVWIGFGAALATKGKRWLVAPFLLSQFIYVVSASCLGDFCHFISGFWYNDIYRTGAMVCIFALPLAVLGLASIIQGIMFLFSLLIKSKGALSGIRVVVATVVIGAFIPANYLLAIPYSANEAENVNSFVTIDDFFHRWYSWDTDFIMNGEQHDFLLQAEEIINEDPGLVANIPFDGTGWMYGIDDLDTMYRSGRGPDSSALDSEVLRKELNKYATSEEVQQAVEELGLKYFVRITPRNSDANMKSTYYNMDDWEGFRKITDKTKGFEKLLDNGVMRLYKLKTVEEMEAEEKEAKKAKKTKSKSSKTAESSGSTKSSE